MTEIKALKFTALATFAAVAATLGAEPVPDFQLRDLNTASPRYSAAAAAVSPRDYILQVSGYYFGHAT
jgi:hypothetical protein